MKPVPKGLQKTALGLALLVILFIPSYAVSSTSTDEDFGPLNSDAGNSGLAEAAPKPPGNLDAAVSNLAKRLVQQGNLQGLPVLITTSDLYESQTRMSLPLAIQLRCKLITEMKRLGCRVLLHGAEAENNMILQGTWQKQGKALQIDLKVMKMGPSGPEAVASASEKIPLEQIDPSALTPDRESWARYLVCKLEANAMNPVHRTLHMGDFQVMGKQASPELGRYLSGWIRPALAESRMFLPLDPQKALRGLSVTSLRTRGTRAIYPIRPDKNEAPSLTADLLKADGEMKGTAWLHETEVEVRIRINNRQGRQFTAATADIPSNLFPRYLLKASPVTWKTPAVTPETTGSISKNGLQVELTTARGEEHPIYRKDEHIKFVIRLNRSAFLYLFDLDPGGNAILLYPVGDNGQLVRGGQCGAMPQPDTPIILPEDGCSYDLVVAEPYGTDRVWVVAAESPLDFPADLTGDWSKASELVRRIRAQGISGLGGYAEAQVEVVTEPQATRKN